MLHCCPSLQRQGALYRQPNTLRHTLHFRCSIDTQHRVYMKTRLEEFDVFIQVSVISHGRAYI